MRSRKVLANAVVVEARIPPPLAMGSVNRYLYEEFETAPTVENLCDTFNKALEEGIEDPLILIPVFIHDFLCIHPFRDGNGRMSRLLTTLLLYRSGYCVGKYVLDKRFHTTPHEEEPFSLEFLQFQRMEQLRCFFYCNNGTCLTRFASFWELCNDSLK